MNDKDIIDLFERSGIVLRGTTYEPHKVIEFVNACVAAKFDSDPLLLFMHACYPVSTEINPRGYNWCEGYLDQALEAVRNIKSAAGAKP